MLFKSKKTLLVFIISFFVLLPDKLFADHTEHSYHLLEEVYTVYELTNEQKYDAASKKLEQVSIAVANNHLNVPKDKLVFIQESVSNVKMELLSDALTDEMKRDSAESIVLMMEAATHKESQLFENKKAELKRQILNTLESDTVDFEENYWKTVTEFQTLIPAFKVELPVSNWGSIDVQLSSMKNMNDFKEMEEDLHVLLNLYEPVEVQKNEEDDDSSFIWLVSTIGGTIVFTLIYVGWRKYKGEKKGKKKYKKVDGL
ncbi:sporulation protein YpjB [Salirhabdus sp. Marseille-P4669]|uniref:sporulation protein YpjB n=1 Tax=Salirhabdus sp. Marseille-P4669 TaxID=2042310 RepID=UPI000C79B508|nr:sporulation protein YpjB [Salirhabdus sp. Marseille-P4669]